MSIKRLLKFFSMRRRKTEKRLSDWQRIFYNSRVNGAHYAGEQLPAYKWHWGRK